MEPTHSDVMVVGGGIAGLSVARAAADLGMSVTLLERDRRLGGHAADWACMATDECARCSACLVQDLVGQVAAHPAVRILTGAQVTGCRGEAGGFDLSVEPVQNGGGGPFALDAKCTLPARSVVLSTGFEPYDPSDNLLLGYGHFDGVVTTRDLDTLLRRDDLGGFAPEGDAPLRVAFLQCIGSRDRTAGREYCSQFCCRTTIRLVQRLRHLRPNLQATVFYIDLQIMSKEFGAFYRQAHDGIDFVQGVPAEVCQGESEGKLVVYSIPPGEDRSQGFEVDRVVLAIGLAPTDSHRSLAEAFGLELDEFGYFAAAGSERMVESARPGIFLAGACCGPTDIQGSRKQALAVTGLLARRRAPADTREPARAPTAT